MAKLTTDYYFKARIDNLLIYPLCNMMVMRTISGFTKETRNTHQKYENCTRSANEFGRVSSLCKQVRTALAAILPKQNNLAVVNSFTKKIREILECDLTNTRGERTLANALATENGRQLLKGYEFNPDTNIAFDYVLTDNAVTINTKNIKFPKGINHIGFRMHRLAFDFETGANEMVSGEWVLKNKKNLKAAIEMTTPIIPAATGVVFTILEVQFYDGNGSYAPMVEDGEKSVMLVRLK